MEKNQIDILEVKYMELTNDIKEIKDDIKTIMDALLPKLNPNQGLIAQMTKMKLDIEQLKVDLVQRNQNNKIGSTTWSVISSSLVTAIIMTIIGYLLRSKGI